MNSFPTCLLLLFSSNPTLTEYSLQLAQPYKCYTYRTSKNNRYTFDHATPYMIIPVSSLVCVSVCLWIINWPSFYPFPSPLRIFSLHSQGPVSTSVPSFSHRSAVFPLPFLARGFVVLLTDTILSHPPFPYCPLPPPPPLVKLLGQTHLVFRLAFACE